jgi:nucleoside-diphosphate-sugar epimerase
MSETILVTGGSGFLGLQLAKELIAQGNKIVIFDLKSPDSLLQRGNSNVVFVRGDITSLPQVLNAVRDFKAESIIHLAALLSEPSEANPWVSINVNALGTYHVFEAARLFEAKKVIFTSSMAVYVNSQYKVDVITEQTMQRPQIIYGITKVFAELLGLYYHRKFGIDVRGIRLPVVIGPNVESPGFGQFNSKLIQAAILGIPFEVNVPEDTVIPLLYVKDAVRSLVMLYRASEDRLITRVYNVGQITPPPRTEDIVKMVRRYYPDTQITFKPDPRFTVIARNTPPEIRADEARNEWGWNVLYSLEDTVKDFMQAFTGDKGR